MSFVKNGRPILINCIAWGRRYLPEVAIINTKTIRNLIITNKDIDI